MTVRLLALTAAITYNNWVLGWWLNPVLHGADGSISEYSAASQTHHAVFQSLDIVSGLLLTALGLAAWRRLRVTSVGKLLAGGTVFLGIANIADALFRLPCAETVDRSCRITVSISFHSTQLPPHAFSSTLIAVCYLGLPLAGLALAGYYKFKPVLWASLAAILAALISFVAAVVQYISEGSLSVRTSGFGQQIEMLVVAVWLVTVYWFIADYTDKRPDKSAFNHQPGED